MATTPTASITQENRLKIETAVEKEVHKYVTRLAEAVYDDTHLFMRRNPNNQLPFEAVDEVLKTVRLCIDNAQLRMMDDFMRRMNATLDENLPPASKK
jgi:hypothetical protein